MYLIFFSAAPGPVSFSIKKMKEPEPILPKPALPYESSSDEETTKETTESNDKTCPTTEEPKPVKPKQCIEIPVTINAQKIAVPEPEPIPKSITVMTPIIVSKPISIPKPITIAKSSISVVPKPVPPPQNNQVIHNEPNSSEKVSTPPLPHVKSSSHKKSHRSERSSSEKWYTLGESDDKRDSLDRRKENKRKRSHSRKRSKRDRCDDVITIDEDSEPVDPSDFIDLTDDIDDKGMFYFIYLFLLATIITYSQYVFFFTFLHISSD